MTEPAGPRHGQDVPEEPADPSRLRRHVVALASGPRSRLHAGPAMLRAEEYVVGELAAAGWQVCREPFAVRGRLGSTDDPGHRALPFKLRLHGRLAGVNLRAEHPGRRGPARRPTVVVGAHLDTVLGSPGADDNASGVAVVLEVARLLGGTVRAPGVTLMIFDMEEVGMIGSREAARRLSRGRRTAGMICLESVGYFSSMPGSQRLPVGAARAFPAAAAAVRAADHRGDFTLVVHRESSRYAAEAWSKAAAAVSPSLRSVLLRDPRPDGPLGAVAGLAVPALNHLGRSDHSAFWNRGVPALMLTGTANFRNSHYHRPSDTPDTLDYERMAGVASATAAAALAWSARCA